MRHYHGLVSVVVFGFIGLFIGCGGGGGGKVNGGPGDCNNSSVHVGETITVPATAGVTAESLSPGAEDPKTIMIDGRPVASKDITVNEDGTVEILVTTLTSLSGTNVEIGSGDRIETLCENVRILPAVKGSVSEIPPDDGDDGDVTPENQGGTAADEDGDGVLNDNDTCPGTVIGTLVDANGCETTPALPAPPAPPAGTTITTFDVKPATGTTAKFSTWEIKWTVANAKAAFLWGDVFNRDVSDAGLAEGGQCQLIGTGSSARYLVTTNNGGAINPDLDENATTDNPKKKNKWYLEGVLCKKGAVAGDPQWCSYKFPSAAEKNPRCRIDLKRDDDSVIATDTIYTRSLVHHGTVCLVVQGQDDAWKTTCKDVTAPEAEIAGSNVGISLTKPVVTVDFDYSNAVAAPVVAGCAPAPSSADKPADNGSKVHYGAECPINGATMKIDLVAKGIGAANSDKKFYEVTLGKPTPTLEFYGASPLSDDSGPVTLEYDVTRSCQVKEGGHVSSCGNVPWVKSVTFVVGFLGGTTTKTVQTLSDVSGKKKVNKDYQHTKWTFKIRDFDNKEYTAEASKGFPKEFKLLTWTNKGFHYNYDYDDCGPTEDCDEGDCCDPTGTVDEDATGPGCGCRNDGWDEDGVWNCRDYTIKAVAVLKLRNIKSATVHCAGKGSNADTYDETLAVDPDNQGTQKVIWTSGSMGGEKVTCDFKGIAYDGQEIHQEGWVGRGGTYCDIK